MNTYAFSFPMFHFPFANRVVRAEFPDIPDIAYFCDKCGRVWATIRLDSHRCGSCDYVVYYSTCPICGDGLLFMNPGHSPFYHSPHLFANLPRPILMRELNILADLLNKGETIYANI